MIITQFNDKYYKWGELFVKSLSFTNPNENIYFDTVNLKDCQIEYLKTLAKNIKIKNKKIDFPENFDVATYMANRRVEVFLDVLNKEEDKDFFMLDADLLFRKPIDGLHNKLNQSHDAAIIFRDGVWEGSVYSHLKVACGVVGVTKKGIPLIKKWDEIMKTENSLYGCKRWEWYWDQISLYEATNRFSEISFSNIEDKLYINRDFFEDAVIWSANKPPKEIMYKKFCNEFEKMKVL